MLLPLEHQALHLWRLLGYNLFGIGRGGANMSSITPILQLQLPSGLSWHTDGAAKFFIQEFSRII
jgi:hypothetical protein